MGVDLERVRPIADASDLAHRFYSRQEYEHLDSVTETSRSEAFLRLWTRKEAYVKAIGAGMSLPFDTFDVLDREEGRGRRLRIANGGTSFVLAGLEGLPGFVGSWGFGHGAHPEAHVPDGIPVMRSNRPAAVAQDKGKRLFDLVGATSFLIVLSPVIVAVAALVRVRLGRPVIYSQERPGLAASHFTIHKFRTMVDTTDASGRLLPSVERTRLRAAAAGPEPRWSCPSSGTS